jgi:two-component system CheB/CheR fusion protein
MPLSAAAFFYSFNPDLQAGAIGKIPYFQGAEYLLAVTKGCKFLLAARMKYAKVCLNSFRSSQRVFIFKNCTQEFFKIQGLEMTRKKNTVQKNEQDSRNAGDDGSRAAPDKAGSEESFPVVGIGASAGGLKALKSFFKAVSETSGMAYIVLVHMSPDQPSMLDSLLQKETPVPVLFPRDGQRIEPDHVYIVPPDKQISINKGKIQLPALPEKSNSFPINLFLQSLARDQKTNAAGIILSGTGSDGTQGIREIKAMGGLAVAQNKASADYDGMPKSAINTGLVDMELPPEQMPGRLISFYSVSRKLLHREPDSDNKNEHSDSEWINKIFAILKTRIGHDFSAYKRKTILRRISRRMGLNHIENLGGYVRYLRENPNEADVLFRELLIGVTRFFREPESYEVLKNRILPARIGQMNSDGIFRVWVPGCSTGEEVYSLAIVIKECLAEVSSDIQLQVFGTDIDSAAIDKARQGLFPESIAADVSENRLKRFFIKEDGYYCIRKEIRDDTVFSVQDILNDPPFSRLNLLCCRNLLIYFEAEAQKRLIPLFHYTLRPEGILMLGTSETIGGFTTLFKTLDKKWKIFSRREMTNSIHGKIEFPSRMQGTGNAENHRPKKRAPERADIGQLTQKAVLEQFAPTAILVNADADILHIQGRTGRYIEAATGPPTHNLLDLARQGLRIELSSALRAARLSDEPVTRKRVAVEFNGNTRMINLHVRPQYAPKEMSGNFLVVFEDIEELEQTAGSGQNGSGKIPAKKSRIAELEKELQVTRESHQATIEELESSNEELKSTNEEMQSANEELQSTNEELESSKEELQSLNEELQTVNAELQSKVEELSAARDDMHNLLNSTEVATIFVDNDLRVRRFTPDSTAIVNLIDSDVGRPLEHVVTNLRYKDMISDLKSVMRKLVPKKTEVQTAEGEWYQMRILPYRTTDNRIDGAVLTFSGIEDQKKAQDSLKSSIKAMEDVEKIVRAVFDMSEAPTVVVDEAGRIIIANASYSEMMNVSEKNVTGMDFINIHTDIAGNTGLRTGLDNALNQNRNFETEEFDMQIPHGKIRFRIKGQVIDTEKITRYRILLIFVEILRKEG